MSARVGFEVAESLLTILSAPRPAQEALSVDLPKGDLTVKEQCPQNFSSGTKTCGHDPCFADTDESCYYCERDAPVLELSRQRVDRRRRRVQMLLVGKSPIEQHRDPSDKASTVDSTGKKVKNRGKWFPVSACCIVPLFGSLELNQRVSGKVDRLGVFRCGSVWTCPSCAQRIAVPRGQQIGRVYDAARAVGKSCFMITGTITHDKETGIRVSVKRLKVAIREFLKHTSCARVLRELGYIGHVIAIEITYPHLDAEHDNGPHPHWHGMFVFDPIDPDKRATIAEDMIRASVIKTELFRFWSDACKKAKTPRAPSFQHGFDVAVAFSSSYLTKQNEQSKPKAEEDKPAEKTKPAWGIEAELTRSAFKEGSKKSRTPFELLDSDDPRDSAEFLEYAVATFGLSQIEWSRGRNDLRAMFIGEGYDDLSDQHTALKDPDWEFADDHVKPENDLIIEAAEIDSDDCWRARKYGRNALDRAIASVDGGGAVSLAVALREEKFEIVHETPMWTEEVQLYHTKSNPARGITAGDPLMELVRDPIRLDPSGNNVDDWQDTWVVKGEELVEFLAYGPMEGFTYRFRHAWGIVTHPKRYQARYLTRTIVADSPGERHQEP